MAILCLLSTPALAQMPDASRPRSRIGIALEDAGALRRAHIRVLRWFEEYHRLSFPGFISVGGQVSGFGSTLAVGTPLLDAPSGRMGVSTGSQLDSPILPRTGQTLRWKAQWFDARPRTQAAFPLSVFYDVIHIVGRAASGDFPGYPGSAFGKQATVLPPFFPRDPGRMDASDTNEIRTDEYLLARLGFQHPLFRLAGSNVYLTSAHGLSEAYTAQGEINVPSRLPMDGAVASVSEKSLGPIAIGRSAGDRGHRK